MFQRKPLSKIFPILAPPIIEIKIRQKSIQYLNQQYRLKHSDKLKEHLVYKSESLLRRKLGNVDEKLQINKIHNLELAIPNVNNTVIPPNKMFSFWNLIKKPTYDKGYLDGMLLADGHVLEGVGGGLCQLANMIHWLFLHTGMIVKEHWHHDYDIFPDSGRTLPFGSGASVFFNYFDLQYLNATKETYTLCLKLTDTHLVGEVWSNKVQNIKYSVIEEDHKFYKENNKTFRENKLYKITIDKITGNTINKQLIKHNNSQVLYEISPNLC